MPGNLDSLEVWKMVYDQVIITPSGKIAGVILSEIITACRLLGFKQQQIIEIIEKIKVIGAIQYS
jgi:hypothetical protein